MEKVPDGQGLVMQVAGVEFCGEENKAFLSVVVSRVVESVHEDPGKLGRRGERGWVAQVFFPRRQVLPRHFHQALGSVGQLRFELFDVLQVQQPS